MINYNEIITVKWNPMNREHLESRGYVYTKMNDSVQIKIQDLKPTSTIKVPVHCDICGKLIYKSYGEYNYIISKNNIYRCKSCTTKQNKNKKYSREKQYQIFVDFCNENYYTPISTVDDYINAHSYLQYYNHDGDVCKTTTDQIKTNKKKEIIRKEKFNNKIEKIKQTIESKNNNIWLNPDEYIDIKSNNLKIICGSCGDVFTTSYSSILNAGGRCTKCGHDYLSQIFTYTPDKLNDIYNKNEQILLNPQDYINNKTLNLKFKCIECGEPFITSKTNYDFGLKRCSHCSHAKSTPEYIIENYLKDNCIKYIYQKSFKDCKDLKPLPFDFYIPSINLCIEYDGKHHFFPIFGQERFKKQIFHDKIKTEYCNSNNINLFRIPYMEYQKIVPYLSNYLKDIL